MEGSMRLRPFNTIAVCSMLIALGISLARWPRVDCQRGGGPRPYNVSEIPRAKGVVLLGPVPATVQAYITYDASVPASNVSCSAAIEFLKFIASLAAAPSWQSAGLELA